MATPQQYKMDLFFPYLFIRVIRLKYIQTTAHNLANVTPGNKWCS